MNYKIKKGDTLSAIAKKYGTTVKAIAKANNIKNVNLIYAGKTITIPVSSPVTQTQSPATQTVSDTPTSSKMPDPIPPKKGSDLGAVKTPGRDVTRIQDLVQNVDTSNIPSLLFEEFSAIELASVERSYTIDGVRQPYSIVSNLSDIRRRYNATRELTIMDKLSPMDGVYAIDLKSKIPDDTYIENNNLNTTYQYLDEANNQVTVEKGNVYIDTNGDLILEFNNIRDNELVQIQLDVNGTIYEVTNL